MVIEQALSLMTLFWLMTGLLGLVHILKKQTH
jgi:hypothetical protein